MIWRRYQNELIVLGALLLMLSMYLYKQNAMSSQSGEVDRVTQSIEAINEVVALKKMWADKKINKKIEKIKVLIPASKMKWIKKNKKITARYTEIKPSELNKLITKILNTPVVIDKLDIERTNSSYKVEFKCRW